MAARLPPEILKLVVEALFPFGDDPKTLYLDQWMPHGRPLYTHGTMANMCLASKMLRDFAIPVLYRLPMTLKTTQLARTLAERPDLARHVLYLHHDCWNNWYGIDRELLGPEFTEVHKEGIAYIERRVAEEEDGPWENEDGVLMDELRDAAESQNDGHILDSIVISLCPNIEKLHVSSYYKPVLATLAPDSLVNLTTVTVSHGDTEMAMHFHLLFYLAKAAPNISTLVLEALSDGEIDGEPTPFPTFPKVTTLRLLRSLLEEDCFPAVTRAFPLMEDFTYDSGDSLVGYGGMHAKQLQDAVVRHAPRLRALHVDMREFFAPDGLEEDSVWDSGLASMRHLESFTMDSDTVEPLKDDSGIPDDFLVRMLPTSLQTFRIFWGVGSHGGPGGVHPTDLKVALLRLAGEVATRFTNLKEVDFFDLSEAEDTTEIEDAFEAAGVDFSVVQRGSRPYY